MKKLFFYIALGRFLTTITGGLGCLLFLNWLIPVLGQIGSAFSQASQQISCTLIFFIFSLNKILKFTVERPYLLLFLDALIWILDALVLIFLGPSYPWAVLVSGTVSFLCFQSFLINKNALINRVISGDELSLFNNRLTIFSTLGGIIGTMLSPCFEASLFNIAIISICGVFISVPLNIIQIRMLLNFQK